MNKKEIRKPDFFIVGASKCGTTSLKTYLNDHPDIFVVSLAGYFNTDFSDDYRGYLKEEDYLKLFEGTENYSAVGEWTPLYIYSKEAIKNILKFNPEAKFIAMIRNPIDMFHSLHAQLLINFDETVKDPEKAWRLQEERKKGESIPLTCSEPKVLQYGEVCKLGKQIKRLLETVPNKKNVKIIPLENIKKSPKEVYESVLEFLNVESDGRSEFPVYNKNTELKLGKLGKIIRLILITGYQKTKKTQQYLKQKLGIKRWHIKEIIKQKNVTRKPLSEEFKKELEEYFEGDQKLLKETLEKYNSSGKFRD